MSDDNRKDQNGINLPFEMNRDKLALLVGGMAVIALIFATYNFFNKSADITSTSTSNENGVELNDDLNPQTTDEEKDENMTSSQQSGMQGPVWVANDYVEGDISGDSYTVVKGDTLWEIAEAVYGDGTQWHKILDANKSSIGYLPNGSQALIVPGQVLVLP